MKLKAKKDEAQMAGVEGAKEFSIDTESSMIVSILRDKLYRNKVAAVCREIASNCRDANREAGREKTPIEITIDKDEDNFLGENAILISFKDSGIGISPDRMDKIFLKYGGSTKRDTNNQTGGFGIGAKTPFAYTNNFVITTVCDFEGKRMKYVYQALIIADGVKETSQLILIDEEETNEHTGTIITVPIGSDESKFDLQQRIREFEWECLHATALWDVKPTYNGFKYCTAEVRDKELRVSMSGKGWKMVEDKHDILNSGGDLVASVDGIPYPIDADEIKEYDLRKKLQNFARYNDLTPIIEIETGEITLSASREDVEYIPDNIEVFIKKYDKMKNDLVAEAKKLVETEKTTLGKITLANKITGEVYSNKTEQDKKCKALGDALGDLADTLFEKQTKDLPKTYKQLAKNLQFILFDLNSPHGSGKLQYGINVEDFKDKKVFYRDRNSCASRNKTLREQGEKKVIFIMPFKDGREFLVTDAAKEQLKNVKKLLKEVGIDVGNYEDVEKTKVARVKAKKESDEGVFVPIRPFPVSTYSSNWRADRIECGKKSQAPIKNLVTHTRQQVTDNSKVILMFVDSVTSLNTHHKNEHAVFGNPKIDQKDALLPSYFGGKNARDVWTNAFYHLSGLGYQVFATSKNKEKYFKKAGFKGIKDIKGIFEKEWLPEQKKAVQDFIDYDAGQKLQLVKHLDRKYMDYPEFLQLADISVDDIRESNKVRRMDRTNDARNLSYQFNENQIKKMASILKLKPKDYGVKITHSQVQNGINRIRKEYPAISIIFSKIDERWDSTISDHGGKSVVWNNVLKPMIEDALSKRKNKS
jgi:hypothetical protein